jgi:hypothetical protein
MGGIPSVFAFATRSTGYARWRSISQKYFFPPVPSTRSWLVRDVPRRSARYPAGIATAAAAAQRRNPRLAPDQAVHEDRRGEHHGENGGQREEDDDRSGLGHERHRILLTK